MSRQPRRQFGLARDPELLVRPTGERGHGVHRHPQSIRDLGPRQTVRERERHLAFPGRERGKPRRVRGGAIPELELRTWRRGDRRRRQQSPDERFERDLDRLVATWIDLVPITSSLAGIPRHVEEGDHREHPAPKFRELLVRETIGAAHLESEPSLRMELGIGVPLDDGGEIPIHRLTHGEETGHDLLVMLVEGDDDLIAGRAIPDLATRLAGANRAEQVHREEGVRLTMELRSLEAGDGHELRDRLGGVRTSTNSQVRIATGSERSSSTPGSAASNVIDTLMHRSSHDRGDLAGTRARNRRDRPTRVPFPGYAILRIPVATETKPRASASGRSVTTRCGGLFRRPVPRSDYKPVHLLT